MKRALAVVLSIGLVAGLGCGQPGGDAEQEVATDTKAAEKTAAAAAEKWLHLVDQGQYAESWDGTAAFFQQAVPQAQWRNMMESVRAPLGELLSRQLKGAADHTSRPGAPAGQYVVVQFAAEFGNGKSAIETVTPHLEKDGTWRVSGYFIK